MNDQGELSCNCVELLRNKVRGINLTISGKWIVKVFRNITSKRDMRRVLFTPRGYSPPSVSNTSQHHRRITSRSESGLVQQNNNNLRALVCQSASLANIHPLLRSQVEWGWMDEEDAEKKQGISAPLYNFLFKWNCTLGAILMVGTAMVVAVVLNCTISRDHLPLFLALHNCALVSWLFGCKFT